VGNPSGFQRRISALLAAVAMSNGGLIVIAGDQIAAVAVSIEPDRFS
jgi:hypothetical protein